MQTISLTLLAPFILIGALGGLVQGFAGFGFSIVVMALLPMLMAFTKAVAWAIVANLVICAAATHLYWKDFRWKQARWLLAGTIIGTPLGILMLTSLDPEILKRLLGLLLLSLPLSEFFNRKKRLVLPKNAAFPFGVGGGMLGGAFNISGPPLVLFTYSQPWPRREAVAALQVTFLASALVRVALSGSTGLLTPAVCLSAVFSLPSALLCLYFGRRLAIRWDASYSRPIINVFMLAMGIKYVCFP